MMKKIKKYKGYNIKTKPKVVDVVDFQSGERKDALKDIKRNALPPGKRLSRNKKFYTETRKNRSDRKYRL